MSQHPLIVGIGELLWDRLPSGKRVGGAPANVVYHASCLGAEGYAVSAVGKDKLGDELLEAASLDGANTWQKFRYIILPNIKMVVSLNLILAVKGAISVFEIPYIMTGGNNGSSTFVI